jgi:hypothetical protein
MQHALVPVELVVYADGASNAKRVLCDVNRPLGWVDCRSGVVGDLNVETSSTGRSDVIH